MKIVLYGGTFDPIHLGHMAAARAAAKALRADRLLLIPAGIPPHKALAKNTAPPADRLAMTALAADRLGLSVPVEVLDWELHREGKSYTFETLQALKEKYPDSELWFCMGTDMFLSFHTWKHPEIIAKLAGLCVFGRSTADNEALFAPQKAALEERYGARIETIAIPDLVEVSSTQIRGELAEGGGEQWLDESVWGYILRKGLYGSNADLKHLTLPQLRGASLSMVRAKRIAHIKGTEDTAAALAQRWGASEEKARKAAILHDCTKYFTLSEQLSTCEKCGILLDDMEKTHLPLLHSKSASGIARDVFGMDEEICSAICWHTTGRADMTLLEKIIYIADYAEPSRKYGWAEELRKLIFTDLDAAVLRGLEITIAHTTEMGQPIHYKTLEAYEWLSTHRKEA